MAVCRSAGVPVIVNDRVDVALAAGAAGLHVGQDDLPAAAARQLLGPGPVLGVSVKTVEQAVQAQADGADYLGAGAGRLQAVPLESSYVARHAMAKFVCIAHMPCDKLRFYYIVKRLCDAVWTCNSARVLVCMRPTDANALSTASQCLRPPRRTHL